MDIFSRVEFPGTLTALLAVGCYWDFIFLPVIHMAQHDISKAMAACSQLRDVVAHPLHPNYTNTN